MNGWIFQSSASLQTAMMIRRRTDGAHFKKGLNGKVHFCTPTHILWYLFMTSKRLSILLSRMPMWRNYFWLVLSYCLLPIRLFPVCYCHSWYNCSTCMLILYTHVILHKFIFIGYMLFHFGFRTTLGMLRGLAWLCNQDPLLIMLEGTLINIRDWTRVGNIF